MSVAFPGVVVAVGHHVAAIRTFFWSPGSGSAPSSSIAANSSSMSTSAQSIELSPSRDEVVLRPGAMLPRKLPFPLSEWVWRPADQLPPRPPGKKPHLESEKFYREEMEGRPLRLYLDVLGGVFLTLQHLLEPYTIRDVPSPVDDYSFPEDEAGVRASREFGEQEVRGHSWGKTRFRSRAGIRPMDVVAGCVGGLKGLVHRLIVRWAWLAAGRAKGWW